MAIEQYANSAATTLNGTITNGATSLVVASAAGFPSGGNFRIVIDSEILLVTAVAGTTFTVTRGAEGTSAAGHTNGATVTHVLTAAGLKGLLAVGNVADVGANLPAAGVAGRLFVPTDGMSLYRDDGAIWTPYGPINKWTAPPLAAALTPLNVTTATLVDSAGGLFLKAPNIAVAHGQFWMKTLPGGAYTWIVRMETIFWSSTDCETGLALRDTASGKIISMEMQASASTSPDLLLHIVQWTDVNTRTGTALQKTLPGAAIPWFKITDDGTTNRTYSVSRDGINWLDVLTEARTTWLGVAPNQAGIFATANGDAATLTVNSWSGV